LTDTVNSRFKPLWCTSAMFALNRKPAYQENTVDSTWLCTTVLKGCICTHRWQPM